MRVRPINGELQFVADDQDEKPTDEDVHFLEAIKNCRLVQRGPSVLICDRTDGYVYSYLNTFDGTQLVNPSGMRLANYFGMNRFMPSFPVDGTGTTLFDCDREFPQSVAKIKTPYKALILQDLLALHAKDLPKLYAELEDLYNYCADSELNQTSDMLCRFNLGNQFVTENVVTKTVFLLDKKNQILGAVSATILIDSNKNAASVFVYDEVVNYFITMPKEEMAKLLALQADKGNLENEEKINEITEKYRKPLLNAVFAEIDHEIDQVITIYEANRNVNLNVKASIRVAKDREATYEALGCGVKGSGFPVAHGDPTPYANLIDGYIKQWAKQEYHFQQLNLAFLSSYNYITDKGARAGIKVFKNRQLTKANLSHAYNLKISLRGMYLLPNEDMSIGEKYEALYKVIEDTFDAVKTNRTRFASTKKGYVPGFKFSAEEKASPTASHKIPYKPAKFEKELVAGLDAMIAKMERLMRDEASEDEKVYLRKFLSRCKLLAYDISHWKAEAVQLTGSPSLAM